MRKWLNKKEIRLWKLYSKERGIRLLNSLRELDKKNKQIIRSMENKYYTPTIEEFHVGFEYEEHLKNNGKWDWEKQVVETVYPFDYYEDLLQPETLAIRVKYLDREDIESLGFVKWPDDDIYDLGEFQLHTNNYTDPLMIAIYDGNSEYCFVGKIKNKSELKRVLKQIGYES